MNWGKILTWAGAAFSFAACLGYLFAHDYKKAAYFFFAACITAVQEL